MRIGVKFLAVLLFFTGLILYFVFNIFIKDIKPTSQRATETILVDTANILAQFASEEMARLGEADHKFKRVFSHFLVNSINAKVHEQTRNKLNYRVYITDQSGIVIFDSEPKINAVGQDYSQWNDVYLTLRGEYGARSTKADATDQLSTVMYVAAPIKVNGVIVGVLTVANPSHNMLALVWRSEHKIKVAGLLMLSIILLTGLGFIYRLNRSFKKLEYYALDVAEGKNVRVPKMNNTEFRVLAKALETMRLELEGKAYIEAYVHALAHELKSPIAAVRGAAEILRESPPEAARRRFLDNIAQQNERMQMLIDRLLSLAKVENIKQLNRQSLDMVKIIVQVLAEKQAAFEDKGVGLGYNATLPEALFKGDPLLFAQALSNLLDNALEFSASGAQVTVELKPSDQGYTVAVIDEGQGIPEYAWGKIFERFYSLPRQNQGKSTGLGLSFVREIAALHGGSITLKPNTPRGVVALLTLPQ